MPSAAVMVISSVRMRVESLGACGLASMGERISLMDPAKLDRRRHATIATDRAER
jgi:hypothetical protein